MVLANAINGKSFTYTSPIINFKSTGVTTLFTTLNTGLFFVPTSYTFYCETVTASNNDSEISIGWTAAAYTDFESNLNFSFNTLGANKWANQTTNPGIGYSAFPANTAISVNVSIADTGTALTGRIIFNGYYVQ